jgi:DNA segregation ATPase FtsK/SpoIIIE-like protein
VIQEAITTSRQRELIVRLSNVLARRESAESEIEQAFASRQEDLARTHVQERERGITSFEAAHARQIRAFQDSREAEFRAYETAGCQLLQEEEHFYEAAAQSHAEFLDDAKTMWQHRTQQAVALFKQKEAVPKKYLVQFQRIFQTRRGEIEGAIAKGREVTRGRCQWPPPTAVAAEAAELSEQERLARVTTALQTAYAKIFEVQHLRSARFLEDGWPVLIYIFGVVLLAFPFYLMLISFGWVVVALATLIFPALVALCVREVVRPIARRQTLQIVPAIGQAAALAHAELAAALVAAEATAARKQRKYVRRREKEVAAALAEYEQACTDQQTAHEARLLQAAEQFASRRLSLEEMHQRKLQEITAQYPPEIERLETAFERQLVDLAAACRTNLASSQRKFEHDTSELATRSADGLREFQQVVADMRQFSEQHFPAWQKMNGAGWQPDPTGGAAAALRFGSFSFVPPATSNGDGNGQHSPPLTFEMPAVLSYPECPSLLLEAEGEGRNVAAPVMQNVMLRLLTTFPPGKVRFTIIDPIGLGQNFSAFMHLADYDERLVSSRIWTESAHVNQRLTDLTEHMENVIQKYLRNEFASIQEYNEQAGEVAEPFQILVIANFPANFSDEAARRLVSIASSGARCGVYTLISTDSRLKLPRNFDLHDLEAQAATLVWDAEQKRFCWKHDDLRGLPLELEMPPGDEQFTDVVRAVGQLAKDAARVEVPFESVLPPVEKWWTGDSRSEIEVPLGRAGAKKLQYMRLGKGTSQHVLIAGKTGSGKSTLLNALITNLAAHYSPDELEFFLIDFKKGVEFKAYAACRLPHARVIAIESEREFGLSVLQRLDEELKRRGDLYRKLGVQDVKGYRAADPAAVLPRVLLVIDEFQEFFTSDDKISHESSLLLDRLVRQGRAFGIHVLLGSQTLSGAYSLARSTLGQMAVRIALQCSESDAHMILSEDNTAARLLNRPGEAIYNDANGLFEGNHPFQVVWLSDQQRESYLERLAALAIARGLTPKPLTIFEGNAPADPRENGQLVELLARPATERTLAPRIWLGAAVAIKDPTDVVFHRQGGNNLLIVGQQEELALGILANSLIALGSQLRSGLFVLDGTRADSLEAGFWERLVEKTGLDLQIVSPREAAGTIGRIEAEVQRRLAAADQTAEPIFLCIHNLGRFRELKKSDDFAAMRFDDSDSPAAEKQFATILREGPALGVHTLIWSDSFGNLSRWLDRQTIRDLGQRVLFQMSAADSSNLMDSPAASRLGAQLALAYSEEQGRIEKFRPYELPSGEWLAMVAERRAIVASSIDDTTTCE